MSPTFPGPPVDPDDPARFPAAYPLVHEPEVFLPLTDQLLRALAGLKGYVTNLQACPDGTPVTAEFVIDAYHRLFSIEKAFRMSKHDLQARPIYHRKRDSIEAHLTIVFAALAVSHWIETTTGWSIKKFVRTARRYRTITIQAGPHTITAADPLPDDLRDALEQIHRRSGTH